MRRIAPTAENGTARRMISVFTVEPVFRYSSRKMITSVIGTTTTRR